MNVGKKWIYLFFAAAILLFVLLYIATHSILIVRNNTGLTAQGLLMQGEKKINLEVGDKKSRVIILGSGRNSAEFSQAGALTRYSLNLKRFLLPKTLNIDFKSPRQSLSLGHSESGCSINVPGGLHAIYYDCPGNLSSLTSYDGSAYKTLSDSPGGELSPFIASPYPAGLLLMQPSAGSLALKRFNTDTMQITSPKLISLGVNSTQYTMQTDEYNSTSGLAVFGSPDSLDIFVLDEFGSSTPRKITIPSLKKVKQYQLNYRFRGDKLYVLYAFPPSEGQGEGITQDSVTEPQTFSVIDIRSGDVQKQIKLDGTLRASSLFVSPGGRAIISGYSSSDPVFSLYMLSGNKFKKINLPQEPLDTLAWADESDFYYAETDKIFYYSPAKDASYLIYQNGESIISELSSFKEELYVSLFKGEEDTRRHFLITDKALDTKSIDSVFPIINDDAHSIISASLYKNKILVKALNDDYYNNRNTPEGARLESQGAGEATKAKIVRYLESLGVDIQKYPVIFLP